MIPRLAALVALLFVAACGKRLPPPPPSPDYSDPDRSVAERSAPRWPAGSDRGGATPAVSYRPTPDAPGPVDAILASPWTRHDGIEERVDWWLEFWQGRARDTFTRYLTRMGRYVDYIDRELAIRRMPPSLRYLPIVEAGYYPPAISPVGAGGLWQFMPPTARWLGLEVTTLVDERLDPYKATPMALEYLLSLNDQFGSWFLTLAAYNSGPGRVERLIRRYGDGAPRDDALFWKIRDRLPAETRDFVPKFLSGARIAGSPARYGFGSVVPDPPQSFDEVRVGGAASLDVLAEAADISQDAMEELNPHLVRGLTPGGGSTLVRVPSGTASAFEGRLASVPLEDRVTFVEHMVGSGETLSHVALMYGVSVSELRGANPSVSPRRMRIGTRLTIPRRGVAPRTRVADAEADLGGGTSPAGGSVASSARSQASTIPGKVHVVSRGESLWTIARRYEVSVSNLRGWNPQLASSDSTIFPGDELKVQEPGSMTYRVRSGDTIWEIAQAHGLSADELLRYNGMGQRALIRPGDEVQIPPGR